MNRIRRTALVTGSALATLVLTLTATFWPGRSGHADAQYAQHSSPGPAVGQATNDSAGSAAVATPAPASASASSGASTPAQAGGAVPPPTPDELDSSEMMPAPSQAGKTPIMHIQGDYDIKELRRLIQLAKDSGFSDSQLRQITVEDEHGNVVNALTFLEAYERAKKEEAARLAAEKAKVYLTPKDLLNELDQKQSKDLDKLRDKMVFVD